MAQQINTGSRDGTYYGRLDERLAQFPIRHVRRHEHSCTDAHRHRNQRQHDQADRDESEQRRGANAAVLSSTASLVDGEQGHRIVAHSLRKDCAGPASANAAPPLVSAVSLGQTPLHLRLMMNSRLTTALVAAPQTVAC
jgi:hypothetical protein